MRAPVRFSARGIKGAAAAEVSRAAAEARTTAVAAGATAEELAALEVLTASAQRLVYRAAGGSDVAVSARLDPDPVGGWSATVTVDVVHPEPRP